MTQYTKRKFLRIIPFGIIGLTFGLVYACIEFGLIGFSNEYPSSHNPYNYFSTSVLTICQAEIMGIAFGITEVFLMDKLLASISFGIKLLIKVVFYVVAIGMSLAALTAISTSLMKHVNLFDPLVGQTLDAFFKDFSFWSILLFIGFIFSLTIIITEMSQHLGQGVFLHFLFGKYHAPREEERIFMFLDLKGSTALAEKMGHVIYFRFLNQYYADISKAIVENGGQIYQYVGDEVIITWALRDKIVYDRCITCFFSIKAIIKSSAEYYMKTFGCIAEFKAGIHCGKVTTGRIGILKKDIVFIGDVLNTASRIQNVCNTYEVDNLISETLVRQLKKTSVYEFEEIGVIPLRGKTAPLKLYTV